jgi:hypothetical protein
MYSLTKLAIDFNSLCSAVPSCSGLTGCSTGRLPASLAAAC